jgi:transcriptional regulator with XRE-family HTH domain
MLVAIEAGEKNVSLSTLDRVAEALNAAFSDLIQAPGSPDPGRINEVAWSGSVSGSKAVLLAKAARDKRGRIVGMAFGAGRGIRIRG